MTREFIFSWDNTGIESIIDVTDDLNSARTFDKTKIWQMLQQPGVPPVNASLSLVQNLVSMLTLRARFNPQRHYEIYFISCDDSLDTEFWTEQWEDQPQLTADLIRERGTVLHSDRATKKPVIV